MQIGEGTEVYSWDSLCWKFRQVESSEGILDPLKQCQMTLDLCYQLLYNADDTKARSLVAIAVKV